MNLSNSDLLAALRIKRSDIRELLNSQNNALADYVQVLPGERVVVRRDFKSNNQSDPGDKTEHFTCTAFVVHALYGVINPARSARPWDRSISEESRKRLIATLHKDFCTAYTATALSEKEVGKLPNTYTTPLHLGAYLVAAREVEMSASDMRLLSLRIRWLIDDVLMPGAGLVYNIEGEPQVRVLDGPPNAYLTYLCVSALRALSDSSVVSEEQKTAVREALELCLDAATSQLTRVVASVHAGASAVHDVVDLICFMGTVGEAAQALKFEDQMIDALIPHAIEQMLGNFVLSDGTLAPKSSVFNTESKFSVVLSTAELGLILLSGTSKWITANQALSLGLILDHVAAGANGSRGWGHKAGSGRRPAFVAASALGLANLYETLLDKHIADICSTELQIFPVPLGDPIQEYRYPTSIAKEIQDLVIRPINSGKRKIAAMSLILGGPPGTGKTTIAKKIATDLGWKLLVLDQGEFLHKGSAMIESETERIFNLLRDLENVVVLFDEIEEMVENRGVGEKASRFLTTSMLPRLHRLRDDAKVVFLIATNHVDKIDPAALRPGRVDMILQVDPPNIKERQDILKKLCKDFHASSNLQELLLSDLISQKTTDFTFGHLRQMVVRLIAREDAGDLVDSDIVNRICLEVSQRLSDEKEADRKGVGK